ncbi:zwei Ig domain protein zig-8-like [Procambarus clarkii]|uniref:zwei Ig domain protein zig-8-like n=1 Tax=Procambarus clarkii TaxID=6728 RepID=UPI003742B02E
MSREHMACLLGCQHLPVACLRVAHMSLLFLLVLGLCISIPAATTAEVISRNGRDAGLPGDPYPELTTVPYFLSPGHRNITASIGQTAYLHCRVALLGDLAQVSWIRKRDLHVLSSGLVVFASDQRFQVIHPEKSENWTLQIKYAQMRDAGVYECQVNTVPKLSMSYVLNVVEARSVIVGPEYVKAGSTINLTCIINQINMQGFLYWYHNRKILDYEGPVKIITREDRDGTVSHLTIDEASPNDSGNYTC